MATKCRTTFSNNIYMERWIYGLYWTCWLYSTAELEISSNHINLGSSSEDFHTQAMLQQKKSLTRQVVLHRCLKGSAVGKFNLLRPPHHQPLCVISQRQEALNSQPLHLTFPKVLFNQHTDSFSTVPPKNSTHEHLLLLCHVSTQPNHLPFSCAFLPSCLSYHNLSFFSGMNLSLTPSCNFLWHENHQYRNS